MKTATSAALARIVARDFASQSEFAGHCGGIDRTAINRDITGRSASIPDDRFGAYLRAIKKPDAQLDLLRARLLDIVPRDLHDALVFGSTRSEEPGTPYIHATHRIPRHIPLTEDQRSALEWLAQQLTEDTQLIDPIMTICERLGWERPRK